MALSIDGSTYPMNVRQSALVFISSIPAAARHKQRDVMNNMTSGRVRRPAFLAQDSPMSPWWPSRLAGRRRSPAGIQMRLAHRWPEAQTLADPATIRVCVCGGGGNWWRVHARIGT